MLLCVFFLADKMDESTDQRPPPLLDLSPSANCSKVDCSPTATCSKVDLSPTADTKTWDLPWKLPTPGIQLTNNGNNCFINCMVQLGHSMYPSVFSRFATNNVTDPYLKSFIGALSSYCTYNNHGMVDDGSIDSYLKLSGSFFRKQEEEQQDFFDLFDWANTKSAKLRALFSFKTSNYLECVRCGVYRTQYDTLTTLRIPCLKKRKGRANVPK